MTIPLLAPIVFALASSAVAQRSDTADADRSLAHGREALALGKFLEASSAFEDAVRLRPDDAAGWSLLARARCSAAEERAARGEEELAAAEALLAQAEEAARKAIDVDARFQDGWAALGHVLVRGGRADEAVATLYHAEKLGTPTPELLIDLSDALLAAREFALANDDAGGAAGKLAEAEAALARANRLFDAQVVVLRRSAELHAIKGEARLALNDYRHAIQLAPGDSALLEAHLNLVAQTESFDEAVDFYTGLVDTPALARWYRSRAHELRGNVDLRRRKDNAAAASEYLLAEQDFRACAKLDPSLKAAVDAYLPSLRSYRGHALTLTEQFPEAEAALLSAIDLDPHHADAITYLHELQDAMWKKFGGESMPKEKWDEIRAFASKLATVQPDDAGNWNNWGYFAREAGKYEESYLAYRRSLALDPENPRYLNDTALILMYHLNRDLDRAALWLEQAITIAEAEIHDSERSSARRAEDEITLGDAYGNLINLLQGTDRKELAIARLREFEQRLPKRTEVDYWKQKLLPDEWKAEQERKAAEAEAAKKAAEEAAEAEKAQKTKDGSDGAAPPPDGKAPTGGQAEADPSEAVGGA